MSLGRNLTMEQIGEFKEAFVGFDPLSTGFVPTKQLGNLMRYLGFNPTKEELQDLAIQVDPSCTGSLKFPDFLDMMSRIITARNWESEIEDSFRCFDRHGIGFVSRQELQYIFQNLGVALDDEEIESLLTEADVDEDGSINYEEFCQLASMAQ